MFLCLHLFKVNFEYKKCHVISFQRPFKQHNTTIQNIYLLCKRLFTAIRQKDKQINKNYQNITESPVFIKNIFHYCQNKSHKKHNLHVHSRNTSRYGKNSLLVLGAHIWNSLPKNIKSTDSIYELKKCLNRWYSCKCYLCIG